MKLLVLEKTEVIREFCKRIPNADNMAIDYGRDEVAVFFGVYTKYFKASEVLDMVKRAANERGYHIQWKG